MILSSFRDPRSFHIKLKRIVHIACIRKCISLKKNTTNLRTDPCGQLQQSSPNAVVKFVTQYIIRVLKSPRLLLYTSIAALTK